MTDVHFYGYKHWTLEEVSRCFYVGKGRKNRPHSQFRNHKWHAIVERYGLRVEICIGPVIDEEACAWEIAAIAEMGTFTTNHVHDDPIDIGCNLTRGGDGVAGYKFTDKQLSKHHAKQNTPETLEKKRLAQLAVSEQKSRNIKIALASPVEKARRGAATSKRNKLAWQDPAYRSKILEQFNNDTTKQTRAEAMKKPELRAKRRAAWQDPILRARMSQPHCSVCKNLGHNRRTCPLLTANEAVDSTTTKHHS
jgi:hypothetical protein